MSTEQSSYDSNMKKFGWADYAKPASIDIYPKDFESKQSVIDILDNYNEAMNAAGEEDKVVSYTDIVGALMSSVTTIVNMISYVLMAFVAISLVVSSIMIGIITYISVLERKKEIGVLRSIGAKAISAACSTPKPSSSVSQPALLASDLRLWPAFPPTRLSIHCSMWKTSRFCHGKPRLP